MYENQHTNDKNGLNKVKPVNRGQCFRFNVRTELMTSYSRQMTSHNRSPNLSCHGEKLPVPYGIITVTAVQIKQSGHPPSTANLLP